MEIVLILFILLQILSCSASSDSSNETSPRTREWITSTAGGGEQLIYELSMISAYASSLHNGLNNSLDDEWLEGYFGVVIPLTFDDGTKWAAKIANDSDWIDSGINSMKALERHCPDIPIPRVQGEKQKFPNSRLVYYFMNWIDGVTLWDDTEAKFTEMDDLSPTNECVTGYNVTLAEKAILDLAEFVYNITTCPIPVSEMRAIDPAWNVEAESYNPYAATTKVSYADWVQYGFSYSRGLMSSRPQDPEDISGLDKMILLSWVLENVPTSHNESFALYFWDMRPPNILVDEQHNLVGVVDWDAVVPIPLELSALSLQTRMFSSSIGNYLLNETQEEMFSRELDRIEHERTSSDFLSQLHLNSEKNIFLLDIVGMRNMSIIQKRHQKFMAEALKESPDSLSRAAAAWEGLVDTVFRKRGQPIPDWPIYIEIQEALGIYENLTYRFDRLVAKNIIREKLEDVPHLVLARGTGHSTLLTRRLDDH